MKSIKRFEKSLEGLPAFIVGNGNSKLVYCIPFIGQYGVLFGCNEGFKDHHVDILGFQDDESVPRCAGWSGAKITWVKGYERAYKWHLDRAPDPVFTFEFLDGDKHNFEEWGKGDLVHRGSIGLILAQIALRAGCNPIVLIGCDGHARLPGFESTNANYNDKDHSKGNVRKTLEGFEVEYEEFTRHAKNRGVTVRKLGKFGGVKVPWVDVGEIFKLPRIRIYGRWDNSLPKLERIVAL